MRVAHLDTGRDWRGGQVQVLALLGGLAERGATSLLLAPPGPLLERAQAAGFETRAWGARGDWDLPAAFDAARQLRRSAPDIVHCHTARAHAVGAIAARLEGLPAVVSRRVPVPVGRHLASRIKYRYGVERYLCVSRRALEELERAGIPRERLALVPSGVDLAPRLERAVDLRQAIGADPKAAVVGTVAALTREKNPTLLVEAARRVIDRLPETRFVWIGEGPERDAMTGAVERAGLAGRVHLLGERGDARALTAQLTLFVLPSSWEGLGTAVLEAQAEGTPVIATDVGGLGDLIENGGNGRLVAPEDPDAMAEAILEALADRGMRERWAQAARESVKAFGVEAMVERTLAQYQAVLRDRAPGAARSGRE